MKGVILETKNRQALVMKEDGSIIRMRNRNYSVGCEIMVPQNAGQKNIPILMSLAASFILIFTVSVYAYFTPYSYISLDVNPSIEYTANFFDRIIAVRTADAATEKLISELTLQHRTTAEALQCTLTQMESHAFFSEGSENHIMIAIAARDQQRAGRMLEKLTATIQRTAENTRFLFQIHTSIETPARALEARQIGTTFGKLRLIQQLRELSSDPESVHDEDWIREPVRNIIRQLNDHEPDSDGQKPHIPNDNDSPGPKSSVPDSNLQSDPQGTQTEPIFRDPPREGNNTEADDPAENSNKQNGY